MKENRPAKNLHTDSSYVDQPENTTRFVLNGIDETAEGDRMFIANEESNEATYQLPAGYIPLDEVNISNQEKVVFSVATDESASEIGIVDRDDNYTTVVNSPDLGFKVTQQINSIYRLRRGCERTIYWTDPKVRYFNLDKPDQFKTGVDWDPDKFSLFRLYDDIPLFNNIEVKENGNLLPGSYNAAIQYLDQDLNPTEWITSSSVVNIYNDTFSKNYNEIRGSINKENDYQNFGTTNKSILFTFSNLDTSYAFYRVAIIEATSGTGIPTTVKVSQEISTQINVWEHTGDESLATITEEEVQEFANIIDEANYIEQIENTLVLGNTKGKQINYCKLQKYASRIKADVTFQTIILNEMTDSNPKSPTVRFEGTGYMPGEIYSFGIVYIFEDGSTSPVYHIPGKNAATENTCFQQDPLIRPMSIDNELSNTFYTDNSTCEDYWGLDSEGDPLLNQPVRHHRFPSRSEILKPLLEETSNSAGVNINTLVLNISGTIDGGYTDETIEYAVEYTIDGNTNIYEGSINVATYDEINGLDVVIVNTSGTIVPVDLYENGASLGFSVASGTTGLTYDNSSDASAITLDDKLYTSEMFGIRFSGIDVPEESEIGEKIVGYYIVRNQRTETNKTILDTGVLTPLLDETYDNNGYFVAHGHIMPTLADNEKIKEDVLGIIHPEHKFNNRQYTGTTQLIKEGEFELKGNKSYSSVITEDVMAGTSYDPEVSKRRERDSDGFTLHTLTRDNEVQYKRQYELFADEGEINELFYLDTLTSKTVTDIDAKRKEIFNVSGDNRIGIVHLDKSIDKNKVHDRLPYVIMKRNLSDPYSSFRYLEYHKDTVNRIPFIVDGGGNLLSGDVADVFGGDSYITPMRYHSSVFYDVRLRKRASKKGILNAIIGVVLVIVGAVLTYFGGGAIGVAIIGYGISQIATGIKKDQIAKVYGELYEAGLRNCVDDDDTDAVFGPNPQDDEVQWLGDTVTNLWFESSVNMAVRNGVTIGIPDFLDAPAPKADGKDSIDTFTYEFPWGGTIQIVISDTTPQNELDSYMLEKLTVLDSENDNGRLYQGFANAEYYELNPDYVRPNRQKIYSALGIEYDCCSACREKFPHRLHYSLQSFQEELTDNYRVFLPNNYRDIEGEKGVITGLYRLFNNLYVHTEEALWHLPQNYQERVTGEIVSFLGTGSFFETPPRKIMDGDEASAGTKYSRGVIKTRNGIMFPSERDNKIYLFNGKEITSISKNNYNWFKNNIPFLANQQYYASNQRDFPFLNNPSNPFGIGFISTYDSKKERLIITKKDFSLPTDLINNDDYEIAICDGQIVLFDNYQQTIDTYVAAGWSYQGIIDCEMTFTRIETEEVEEDRQEIAQLPNNTDIHIFFDTSGSFDAPALAQIDAAVDDWIANFASSNPDWTGTVYKYNDATEQWVNYASTIAATTYGGVTADKNIIVISFCNEANASYHGTSLTNPITAPTATFTTDYNNFTGTIHPAYNSFIGIHYPVVFDTLDSSKEFLLHSLAALKGVSYSAGEIATLENNPGLDAGEQSTLETALQGANPYPDDGLENYGWLIKENRYKDGDGNVISSSQFQTDINELLEGTLEITNITVTVERPVVITETVAGTVYGDIIDLVNSWTMSYSLKSQSWVGWHSYLPDFYMYDTDRFYSWKNGNDNIWKHNVIGNYQTFYGTFYPHIVEVVLVNNPLVTKIWDWLSFQTEAKEYISSREEYLDKRYVTHNKLLVYNTRQSSGILNLIVKDTQANSEDYLSQQIDYTAGDVLIDRNERDWTVNDLRDIVTSSSLTLFDKRLASRQAEYFIDKIVNSAVVNFDKDWTQLESFRDKFLVVRFIFDNFDNTQLITNYSISSEYESKR